MSIKNNTTSLQELLEVVNNLPDAGGVELPTLTNEGSSSDLLSGKQLIDGEGNVVTGTIPTKTASNLTASGATVTVPSGYYASQATKSVATATQATPSISVDSAGKITATATQSAGYVSAGTKTGTKQLTTQAAKTITPSKSSQTAVASGVYTTGAVTVAAIPSQYITTTDATASADEIMSGETAYVNGSKITGTFSIDSELTAQDDLIAQIQAAVDNLPAANSGGSDTSDATATADKIFLNETAYVNNEKVTGTFTIDSEITIQDSLITQLRNAMAGKAAGSGSGQIVPLTVSASGTYDASNYIPFNTEIPFKNVIDKENIESLEYTMDDDLMEAWGDYVAGVSIGNAIFGDALSHNGYLSAGEYGIEVYVATGQCLLYGESIGWINPETGEPTSAPSFELTNGIMERNYQTNPYLCAMLNMPLAYNPVTVSGSGEYEIYTLNVELSYPSICTTIICTTLNNGIISMYHNQLKPSDKNSLQNFTIENVLCGSPVIVTENEWDSTSTGNLECIGGYPIDVDTNLSSTDGVSIYCKQNNATSSDASIRIVGGLEE